MNNSLTNGSKSLVELVSRSAILDHYSLLGDGNIRPYDWEKVGDAMTGAQQKLWKFLLLGESLPKAEATKLLGVDAYAFLAKHKLCETKKGSVSLGALRLVSFWGGMFFIERGPAVSAYIGEDTKALMPMLPRLSHGRCLFLYPSAGLETWAFIGAPDLEFDFFDVKARPDLLAVNLALNFPPDRCHVLKTLGKGNGNYDVIVSSVPSYFQAPGVKLPKSVEGGPDGLKCLRKTLTLANRHLAEQGEALLTFVFFAENDSKAMETKLREVVDPYGLDYHMVIPSKLLMEPGVPIFNHLVSLAEVKNPDELQAVMDKTLRHGMRKKLTTVYLVKARFWKSSAPVKRQITNYSESYYGTWTI